MIGAVHDLARRADLFGRRFILRSALVLALIALLAPAFACGAKDACAVEGGFYLVRPPSGWDRKAPMPAVMFFHGFRETADSVMANADLVERLDKLGVLLIAPQGAGQSWSFPGSPARHRDEFIFINAVLDDVMQRFPIDQRRFLASGFSQGASMAWNLACHMGEPFAGFAPIAGAYWRPYPTRCQAGPVNLRHVHGLNDRTVPMEGRALRDGAFRQGDVREAVKYLLRGNRCEIEPLVRTEAGLRCEIWRGCGGGREAQLCLHDGGHDFDARFVEDAVRWLEPIARADKAGAR